MEKNKRPRWLAFLCILTMVNTGLSTFSNLAALFVSPDPSILEASNEPLSNQIKEYEALNFHEGAVFVEKIIHMNEVFFESYFTYHFLLCIVFILGFVGAYFMMKGFQLGFHLYIVYSILSIAHIYVFVLPKDVPTAYVLSLGIISAAMIWFYSKFRNWFRSEFPI